MMSKAFSPIRFLDEREMEQLHRAALSILADVGMRIDHDEALDFLASYGCRVDRERREVRFPIELVERTVARMRKDYALGHRSGVAIPIRFTEMYLSTAPRGIHADFRVNAGGFPPYVIDLEGNRRPATLQDVRDSIRLADALENIDLIGLPCSAQEVAPALRPIVMAAELVKHTSKPGGIEAWARKDVEYITRIAAAVRGGEERLRQHPFLIGYGEARSPLCLDRAMAEVFVEYVKRGFPQSLDTMPNGGATGPAASAGVLALGLAETLGGLVLGYAIDENAWVSIDVNPGLTDMRTMGFPYAGADRLPLLAAATQMLTEYYGRPGGCHGGKTDACFPGVQAGMEKALSVLFPILAGATGVGTLGQLEGGMTFSFEQLVLDNEIVGFIKRALSGFAVNEETLALNVIKEVGIGGSYLTHEHTASSFRREFYLSDLVERLSWDSWKASDIRGMEERAKAKARSILATHHPEPLASEVVLEIDAIVAAAAREYGFPGGGAPGGPSAGRGTPRGGTP